MRQLKFRVWNGEQMVSPDYITREGLAWWKENSIPTSSNNIMQYIGVNATNNNKYIFEGDICRVVGGEECQGYREINIVGVIKFGYGAYNLVDKNNIYYSFDIMQYDEIIILGNIYENTELLSPEEHKRYLELDELLSRDITTT